MPTKFNEAAMSDFKRSPSKVWWASESVEWREVSQSPGSQDSGFSDTETSADKNANPKTTPPRLPDNIFKPSSEEKPQNLSSNYREKTTPVKAAFAPEASPKTGHLFVKNSSPKVSRNLFCSRNNSPKTKDASRNQYASKVDDASTCNDSVVSEENISFVLSKASQSLPLPSKTTGNECAFFNKSAPILRDEQEESFNSLSSDCESELECLFNPLESPTYTSTPNKMRNRRNKVPLNQYLRHRQERIPQRLENPAVDTWMVEIKRQYESECMTTLQCKSIAAELNEKVSTMASYSTLTLRKALYSAQCIQDEYKNLNSEKEHVKPLMQSLTGNIIDFLETYSHNKSSGAYARQIFEESRTSPNALEKVSELFSFWQSVFLDEILVVEVKKLVDRLECACSDVDLRATITGITSLCLRNEELLIDLFIKKEIIPILLILCEKCEGSSMRSILLRALATMSCNATAIRHFEKYSGIQIVTDTLKEDSRPEPERSEAVALLAQVTAPWIEDNHCIRGLQEYSKFLVVSLTKFAASTKCCQNILLCAAALANLSTMDSKCIKYMLHVNTIKSLLDVVNGRGPRASVYLLEQVATLIANMSAFETARKQLTKVQASRALLHFLKPNSVSNYSTNEDVEKRLQQKSIIALSRLCGEREAANQVVAMGGVEKLVKMCREKAERFDSDAVLVATLATLRKISDTCGTEVINAEDAQELVEPKLLDSFLAYSTQSESYV